MKYLNIFLSCSCLFWATTIFGQHQKPQIPNSVQALELNTEDLNLQRLSPAIPPAPKNFQAAAAYESFANALHLSPAPASLAPLKIVKDKNTGLPIAISGNPKKELLNSSTVPEDIAFNYLEAIQNTLQIENPKEAFKVRQEREDENGEIHLRLQQEYRGIPVFGSEVVIHIKDGKTDFFNGRYFPSPELSSTTPTLDQSAAIEAVKKDIIAFASLKKLTAADFQFLPSGKQFESQLVIYHKEGKADAEHLAWQITAFPNITQRWEYFVDAQTGLILHRLKSSCQLWHEHGHEEAEVLKSNTKTTEECTQKPELGLLGPVTANAQDLQNTTRTINVYEDGGRYYMIDASRSMHQPSQSNFPDEPAGVIWTLDAGNTSPQNSNFNSNHVQSTNNTWTDRNSVSAHFNGGIAYEYFNQVHSRNSINGSGGNIISLINVSDENGNDMDNAFWNGAAMFYGNGRQAFNAPLAKALDVAGHEMSHGVIQATANLTYENQSGALNESFADIFGAMLDRDDWKIGEEVANGSVFPSGTMRDMQNPHNGGNSNDFYWQPERFSEFVNLPNTPNGDFGGVHINSGIPNHAYYLFATSVGKDKAEKVYYKALQDYLVASSQFVDLRIAVLKAADDLYDQTVVAAAATAFDQVEIIGDVGGEYETDVDENPGQEAILYANLNSISLLNPTDGSTNLLSNTGQTSRPSISDDGSFVVFVDDQKRLKGLTLNWGTGNVQEYNLEDPAQSIWRNIATSKDGLKVAFLYELSNDEVRNREIVVFDFSSQTSQTFELYNPTTSGDGASTGDVQYADVLEWDVTGEYLLYDAFNELTGVGGNDISYWDIGLIRVWNNAANNFANGVVTKLFTGLQENESIGNPTFSKNSPYIIAFDYFATDNFGQETYVLYGANIETNDLGVIDNQIFKLSFPSYAPTDKQILYSDISNGQDIIIRQDLNGDKIEGLGNWEGLINNTTWAIWFANGQRDLVKVNETTAALDWHIFPNPFTEQLTVDFESETSGTAQLELIDFLGRNLYRQNLDVHIGSNRIQLPVLDLGLGTYTIRLGMEGVFVSEQVVKLR